MINKVILKLFLTTQIVCAMDEPVLLEDTYVSSKSSAPVVHTELPLKTTTVDLGEATPVTKVVPTLKKSKDVPAPKKVYDTPPPKKFYVGIYFKDVKLESVDHKEPFDINDIQSQCKGYDSYTLDHPHLPKPHVTLYNGTISDADFTENEKEINTLRGKIQDSLKARQAEITAVEIGGLWAGTGPKVRPYNIVMNLTEAGSPFVAMAGQVKTLINESGLAGIIEEKKYSSYEASLKEWDGDFKAPFKLCDGTHDLSSGFLHLTLATAYPTMSKEVDEYDMDKRFMLETWKNVFNSWERNKTTGGMMGILFSTLKTVQKDKYNGPEVFKLFKENAEANAEKNKWKDYEKSNLNTYIGKCFFPIKSTLGSALKQKKIGLEASESDRFEYFKGFLDGIMNCTVENPSFNDYKENLENLFANSKTELNLTDIEKKAENQKADAICAVVKAKTHGQIAKAHFSWLSVDTK